MRYEVREVNSAYGVWDVHLCRWETNAFDMDEMSEIDAEVLCNDLNYH